MTRQLRLMIAACMAVGTTVVVASEPIVYPAKGQTPEQIEQDKYACYQWAKNETGVDPMAMAQQSPPSTPQSTTSSAGRGALRGAAGGAIVGAIAGDAGKGAAIGAGVGALGGGARRRQEQAVIDQQQASQTAAQSQNIATYNRAFSVCMEGRGYTVK